MKKFEINFFINIGTTMKYIFNFIHKKKEKIKPYYRKYGLCKTIKGILKKTFNDLK